MTRIDGSYTGDGSGSAVAELADREPGVRRDAVTHARHLVFSLQIGGWSEIEAGNLVALQFGIRPVHGGWRASEIEHLRFLRALVETGRIAH